MALKPCKECRTEVSTTAFRCPSCGASNPTLDGKKALQGCLTTLLIVGALIAFLTISSNNSSNTSQVLEIQSPSSTEAQTALEHIKGLNWVKDATYQDFATVQWQVGILDNGRNPTWAAQSICDILSLYGFINQSTSVRIVDIKKVSQGQTFREASLGRINCKTGEHNYP